MRNRNASKAVGIICIALGSSYAFASSDPEASASAQLIAQTAAAEIPRQTNAVLPSACPEDQLAEIIVTAQRRQENLQTVPLSVTALTGENLQQLGARNFADYANTIPGLSFASGGPGLNRIAIRGISSTGGSSATVGYYLDEVPISEIRYNPDIELFDINRVEVLRGPQGTLYGSGSMGGTIKIITNAPRLDDWSGSAIASASVTHSGGFNDEAAGTLNIPVIPGSAAFRATVFSRHNDGYIDRAAPNLFNPTVADPRVPIATDVNIFQSEGIRAAFPFRPIEQLTFTPAYFYQRQKLADPQTIDTPPGSQSNLLQLRISAEPETDSISLASLTAKYSASAWEAVFITWIICGVMNWVSKVTGSMIGLQRMQRLTILSGPISSKMSPCQLAAIISPVMLGPPSVRAAS